MSENKIKKVMIDTLKSMESNIIDTQCKIAILLKLFGETTISLDGKAFMKALKT